MLKFLIATIWIIFCLLTPQIALARVTPEDIINSKKQSYQQQVSSYSPENKTLLERISSQLAQINNNRSQELAVLMERQGGIYQEYLRRHSFISNEQIENVNYWLTYAHEAVAYQQAKIYVFDLTNEANLKSDIRGLISAVQGELNTTRKKVINSQNLLEKLVAND